MRAIRIDGPGVKDRHTGHVGKQQIGKNLTVGLRVHAIVGIIVATAIITVICNVLGV